MILAPWDRNKWIYRSVKFYAFSTELEDFEKSGYDVFSVTWLNRDDAIVTLRRRDSEDK